MALGNSTFLDLSTAVSDIFAAEGDELKAKGAQFEQQSYLSAAALATQNEQFTEMSTAIKQTQADRALSVYRHDQGGRGWRGLCRKRVRAGHSARERERGCHDQGGARRATTDHRGRLSGTGAELH